MSAPLVRPSPGFEEACWYAGVPIPGGDLILGGRSARVAGVGVVTYRDDARCAPEAVGRVVRRRLPQFIVAHTTQGQPHVPPVEAEASTTRVCDLANYQTTTTREVGWDITNSRIGVAVQQNDPSIHYTEQAGRVNGRSLGIENEQGPGGVLSQRQIVAFVRLCDTITLRYGMQRQIPARRLADGRLVPDLRLLRRFTEAGGDGEDWWGVCAHANITSARGEGDPGPQLMQALLDAGYEGWDVSAGQDIDVWAARQRAIGAPVTGVPGPETCAALRRWGIPSGILVRRLGDPWQAIF